LVLEEVRKRSMLIFPSHQYYYGYALSPSQNPALGALNWRVLRFAPYLSISEAGLPGFGI
jgi:hypothetical protein